MKFLILFTCTLVWVSPVLSQKSAFNGVVEYTYNLKGNIENYELSFTESTSVYKHHQPGKTFVTPEGYEIYSLKRHYDWYLNAKTREVTHFEKLADGTLVYSVYPAVSLEWELQDETKEILGYKVQKAISKKHHFDKGSPPWGDAVAWFAIDIPCNSGPERFWGLPGLILELGFTAFNSKYVATKITNKPTLISIPIEGIKVPKEQLMKRDGIDKKWLKPAKDLLNNDN